MTPFVRGEGPAETTPAADVPEPSLSAWGRFRRNRAAVVGAGYLALLLAAALAVLVLPVPDPNAVDLTRLTDPPSAAHLLGTDAAGRDVLSRLVHASWVSLPIGIAAVVVYVVFGTLLGAVAGYFGGWQETLIMRSVDTVLAFPGVIFIIVFIALAGSGILNLIFVIAFLSWPSVARLVHGQTLSLRERQFVSAERVLGASHARIVLRHIVPNTLSPVIVNATFGVAGAILTEAGLSFLGLGVQPPTASWGNMIYAAQSITVLEQAPWLWIPPGLAISLTVLAINFVGEGLSDALHPRALLG